RRPTRCALGCRARGARTIDRLRAARVFSAGGTGVEVRDVALARTRPGPAGAASGEVGASRAAAFLADRGGDAGRRRAAAPKLRKIRGSGEDVYRDGSR